MRILITGGAGFIGSHVAAACLAQGHDVAIVDDLSTGALAHVPPGARFYPVDVRDSQIDEVFAVERPQIVSHHAAQVSVRRSMEEPIHDADVNVLGSLHLLEAARRHGVRRVVFASTGGAIYGEVEAGAADEHHRCRPRSPYAVAKLAVEHYLASYCSAFGLEAVVLRYANVYGPRQDPHGEAGVVAIFIQRILAGLPPTIYGDGEQVRDFVYVDDVVRANMQAQAVTAPAGDPLIVNVATGRGTTVNALWQALVDIARPSVTAQRQPARAGDLVRSVLDPARAERVLGWRPEVDLERGVRETWAWFSADRTRERAVA
jgi:UDP-glucose 4-epimerase